MPKTAAPRPVVGAGLLFVAAVVWGFAFVPQKASVVALPPFSATAVRFCLAAPLALALAGARLRRPGVRVRSAVLLGVILFVIYTLQTASLVYAPIARVSLITGMYAVFVPLFAPLFGHQRPTLVHWLGAGLAFAGLLALTGVVGGSLLAVPLNIGDLLVLGHAIISAFQVLLVGRVASRADPLAFNAIQLTTVAALAIPAALVVDGVPALGALGAHTWLAFGYLAAFSTVFAFMLQLFGQRYTSPPAAAVVMLLETPIGVLAALLFAGEQLQPLQWAGAVVLLGGVAVSLAAEIRRAPSERSQPAQ